MEKNTILSKKILLKIRADDMDQLATRLGLAMIHHLRTFIRSLYSCILIISHMTSLQYQEVLMRVGTMTIRIIYLDTICYVD